MPLQNVRYKYLLLIQKICHFEFTKNFFFLFSYLKKKVENLYTGVIIIARRENIYDAIGINQNINTYFNIFAVYILVSYTYKSALLSVKIQNFTQNCLRDFLVAEVARTVNYY